MKKIAIALVVLASLSAASATMFVVLQPPPFMFYQEEGTTYRYWGDVFGDPNAPYPVRVDVIGGENVIVDPNTGTPGFLSNSDPNYIKDPNTPNDPKHFLYWGFSVKMPMGFKDVIHVNVRATKLPDNTDRPGMYTERRLSIRPLALPVIRYGGRTLEKTERGRVRPIR